MQAWLDANSPVDGEDLERHDKWLSMMWPRLHLLRELLSDDGVIFVSIDDNEQHHLRMMMDEVFGEDNFLAAIAWQHRFGRSNNAKLFSNQREFLIVYRRTSQVQHIRIPRDSELNLSYSNPDNDPRGSWASSSYVNPATAEERPNLVYPIHNSVTGREVSHPTHAWKYSLETHQEHVREEKIWWGRNGRMLYPRLKNFLHESVQKGIVPIDLILGEVGGTTDEGTRSLLDVFDNSINFNNPKPPKLIRKVIEIAEGISGKSGNSVILDSFAGSGTTAHAVLALNKEDGGNRKFILVECEDYADAITAERVRRVIAGVPNARDKKPARRTWRIVRLLRTWRPHRRRIHAHRKFAARLSHPSPIPAPHRHRRVRRRRRPPRRNDDGLFRETADARYHLLYKPDAAWLRSGSAMLNSDRANRIHAANKKDGKKAIVFASGKYMGQRELTRMGITFCQIPYEIHRAG